MTSIEAPGLLTFTIAIVVFFAGAGLNRIIPPLRRWNIPEAVTGGLLAAVLTLIAYVGLGFSRSASRSTRATCSCSISSPASASTPSSTTSFRAAGLLCCSA